MDAAACFRALGHGRTNRLPGPEVRARAVESAGRRAAALVASLVHRGPGGGERTACVMNNPTVSVIVPCYNAAAYIEETLDSVYRQREVNLDVIAVDDG